MPSPPASVAREWLSNPMRGQEARSQADGQRGDELSNPMRGQEGFNHTLWFLKEKVIEPHEGSGVGGDLMLRVLDVRLSNPMRGQECGGRPMVPAISTDYRTP